jgi:hypothetical protein
VRQILRRRTEEAQMMINKLLSGLALTLAVTATAPAVAAQSLPAPESLTQPGQDQVILEGTVLSTTDQSVLLRTYDGRSVFVNLAGILPEATPFLTAGQHVAVLGHYGSSGAVFIARDIQPV